MTNLIPTDAKSRARLAAMIRTDAKLVRGFMAKDRPKPKTLAIIDRLAQNWLEISHHLNAQMPPRLKRFTGDDALIAFVEARGYCRRHLTKTKASRNSRRARGRKRGGK